MTTVAGTSELLGEWLDRELTDVPQELAVRIRTAMPGEWRAATLADGAPILTRAAVTELASLLERGCDTRRAAPGLLTVDALVSYACECLARGGGDIEAGTAVILNSVVQVLPGEHSAA